MTITINGTGTVTGANTLTNTNTVTSAAATALTLQSAGTTAVTIDTSQNVGVGTTSPSSYAKLVSLGADNATTFAAVGATNMLRVQGYNSTYVGTVLEAVNLAQSANTPLFINGSTLKFGISGTTQATIDSSGDLTVGNAVAATNRSININGVANKAGRIAFQESGAIKWLIGNGAASENGVFQIYDNVNGTGVQLARGGTSWTAISDEREKDIIEPITDAATKVATLRAVIGKYKTDVFNTRRSFLIAQDVQAVLPEAVDDTNLEKLGVRYTEVIPLLVAAINELNAKVTTLENK